VAAFSTAKKTDSRRPQGRSSKQRGDQEARALINIARAGGDAVAGKTPSRGREGAGGKKEERSLARRKEDYRRKVRKTQRRSEREMKKAASAKTRAGG